MLTLWIKTQKEQYWKDTTYPELEIKYFWFLTPKGTLFCHIYSLCVSFPLERSVKGNPWTWVTALQILNGEWQLNPASKMLLSLSKPNLILLYEAAKEENSWWTGRIEIMYGIKTSRMVCQDCESRHILIEENKLKTTHCLRSGNNQTENSLPCRHFPPIAITQ